MHRYLVADNQQISPTTLLLTLKKSDTSRLFSFQPGQYAAISFYRHGRPTPARCFSIVSSPTNQEILQFSMRTKGHFTKAMTTVKAGDKVIVRGPFGGFVYDTARDADTVLLAGGIGVTPFMSMLHYAADTSTPNNISLIYSCQSQDDIPFLDEITALEKRNPRFSAVFVIGNGPTDKLASQKVAIGRITPEIIDYVAIGAYSHATFFICGPPPFMKGMVHTLQDKGAAPSRIMTEAFSQGPNRQTGKMKSWPINMYILGAVGVTVGSIAIMVSDLMKTLPPSSVVSSLKTNNQTTLTNSRQVDLDRLVNSLSETVSSAPASPAVTQALAKQTASTSTPTSTTSGAAKSTPATTKTTTATNSSSTSVASPAPTTSTPTPAPAPAPTPAPVKKCTTTQSGVTTCV